MDEEDNGWPDRVFSAHQPPPRQQKLTVELWAEAWGHLADESSKNGDNAAVAQEGDTRCTYYAEKEAEELKAKRAKDVANDQVEDSDEEEIQDDQAGVQSDGGVLRNRHQICSGGGGGATVRNNNYGASGSSAGYSDSEILGLKASLFKRPAWRPRNNRFYAGSEYKNKLWQKKNKKNKEMREQICGDSVEMADNGGADGGEASGKKKTSKREIRCGKCKLKGHNATQCYNLPVTDASAAAYFDV